MVNCWDTHHVRRQEGNCLSYLPCRIIVGFTMQIGLSKGLNSLIFKANLSQFPGHVVTMTIQSDQMVAQAEHGHIGSYLHHKHIKKVQRSWRGRYQRPAVGPTNIGKISWVRLKRSMGETPRSISAMETFCQDRCIGCPHRIGPMLDQLRFKDLELHKAEE